MKRRLASALLVGAGLPLSLSPAVPPGTHPVASRAAGGATCGQLGLQLAPTGAVTVGGSVLIRATARCRPRGLRFAFFLRAGSIGPYALLRGWGPPTVRWATDTAWPGSWSIAVWARAPGDPGTPVAATTSLAVTDGMTPARLPVAALLPPRNPASDVRLGPDFRGICAQAGPHAAPCRTDLVVALDRARAAEGLPPLQLPLAVERLTPAELLLVLTDEERVSRGLPPALGLSPTLDGVAMGAARGGVDVLVPRTAGSDRIVVGGTNWAHDLGALAAAYDWMYQDGWGALNLDCPLLQSPGCWGHRDTLLRREPPGRAVWLVMGAAQAPWPGVGGASDVEILAAVHGPRPRLLYTWARAVQLGF
ncbi:MAG TPA: hypothetical protein VNN74_04500 [Candidatus Micrarchaeia archaeon]|nr:hypothetical protein [Candidatus Micrarchaeia archaeon]